MDLREVLGNLSEQSLQDENLLSSRERELLTNILRELRKSGGAAETGHALTSILARGVGETLLQRAAEATGRGVLRGIESQRSDTAKVDEVSAENIFLASPPPPATGPRPPSPSGPGPGPKGSVSVLSHRGSLAVEQERQFLRAECVVFEEFLAPEELKTLTQYALGREADFRMSEVISPGVMGTVIDSEHRRSRVLMDVGDHERLIRDRIEAALPRVLEKLSMETFPITRFESQLTASNDGDFFRHHFDNAEEEIASRELTYVYFFHREPKAFQGGELRLHDAEHRDGSWVTTGSYRAVVPEQNQIVFFPSALLHEITPVVCRSRAFVDSRFTVNGWLHR